MRYLIPALIWALTSVAAQAQVRDSVFEDYDAYSAYVDDQVFTRNFDDLVLALGGRDEYTPEQLSAVNRQLRDTFPRDFEHRTTFMSENLGGGMSRESRAYWTGEQYAYFFALLHDREDGLVVINFRLNSSVDAILEKY